MPHCNVCRVQVARVCERVETCEVLDELLGPVHPPKHRRPNQCAYRFGCEKTRVKHSSYCLNHRNEMHNRAKAVKLGHKRKGTK